MIYLPYGFVNSILKVTFNQRIPLILKALRYISPIFLCMILASCETEVDFSQYEMERSVIVNAIFNRTNNLEVQLNYSRHVLDNKKGFDPVLDAKVQIINKADQHTYDLHHVDGGLYVPDKSHLLNNAHYCLRVEVPGRPLITAETYLPKRVEVEITKAAQSDGLFKVDFNIMDDETEDNFYVWDIVMPDRLNDPLSVNSSATYRDWLYSYDQVSDPISNSNYGQSKIYLKDLDFANSIIETSVLTTESLTGSGSSIGGNEDPNQTETDTTITVDEIYPILRVVTASEELYEYYRSVERYYQNGPYNTSYSNPSDLYSNINGGHGIFAAYSETLIEIKE